MVILSELLSSTCSCLIYVLDSVLILVLHAHKREDISRWPCIPFAKHVLVGKGSNCLSYAQKLPRHGTWNEKCGYWTTSNNRGIFASSWICPWVLRHSRCAYMYMYMLHYDQSARMRQGVYILCRDVISIFWDTWQLVPGEYTVTVTARDMHAYTVMMEVIEDRGKDTWCLMVGSTPEASALWAPRSRCTVNRQRDTRER